MDLLQRLLSLWTEHDISIPTGASDTDIATFESRTQSVLPADLRTYFTTVNGMGERGTTDNDFFSFWQLSDIESIAEFVPDRSERVPDASRYFIIADHSISLPSFAIRLSTNPNVPSPIASVFTDNHALELEYAFDSFTEFLRSYLDNPEETSATFPGGA